MEPLINEIKLTQQDIKEKIYVLRGQKVMLDYDLAKLYGYSTKSLNQQVKRNIEKFPRDFMFKVTRDELITIVKSQFVTSPNSNLFLGNDGGTRYLPNAFSEQGIYMLMTVLSGELATKQSILIIRTFQAMKNYIIENRPLLLRNEIDLLRNQVQENTDSIKEVNDKLALVMDSFVDPSSFKEF